jgi:hypothetical protein
MSLVGSQRLAAVELHWPYYGGAWARVSTEVGAVPAGPARLTIGDLVLPGAILPDRAGINAPSAWSGIWAMGSGWDTVLPPRASYQSDDGVRLKTVLSDLARECGNLPIALPADIAVGTYWSRPLTGGDRRPWTGKHELAALARGRHVPTPYWIDSLGVTKFGARPTGTIRAAARVTKRDLTRGMRLLGVDSPLAFAPGLSFEGEVIYRMVVREKGGGSVTVETWTT